MKKLLILFLLIPFVYGLEEGDILSQEQLDSININNLNPATLDCRKDLVYREGYSIVTEMSCLSGNIYNESHYIIYRENYYSSIGIWEAYLCLTTHTTEECINIYQTKTLNDVSDFLDYIKRWVASHQTHPNLAQQFQQLINFLNNLNLFP